jgi:TRAP-type C4-dicarboxylate transport system substrate-binding protein
VAPLLRKNLSRSLNFLIVGLMAFLSTMSVSSAKSDDSKLELNWRLVHGPKAYAEFTANFFTNALREKLGAKVKVVVDHDSTCSHVVRESIDNQVVPQLKAGELQIAQIYTEEFEQKDERFSVLSLPYLFRDHEHVTTIVEGPVGKKLLEGLHSQGLTGLAFSYSGGYQNFLTSKKLSFENENTIAGLSAGNTSAFLRKVLGLVSPGNILTQLQLSERPNHVYVARGMLDLSLETYSDMDYAYNDYAGPRQLYYYGTEFNVLFTAIVMSEAYFNSLPAQYQKAIREAAVAAGRAERQLVIADSKRFKEQLSSGFVTNPHSRYESVQGHDLEMLKKASKRAYDSLTDAQKTLVEEILNTRGLGSNQ